MSVKITYRTTPNGVAYEVVRTVGAVIVPVFPALAICYMDGCWNLEVPATGADMCEDCYRISVMDEVECDYCIHEWDAAVRMYYPVELCGTCEDEDAPWAEGDRLRAEWKER